MLKGYAIILQTDIAGAFVPNQFDQAPGAGQHQAPGAGQQQAPGAGQQQAPGAGQHQAPGAGQHQAPGAGQQPPGISKQDNTGGSRTLVQPEAAPAPEPGTSNHDKEGK